MVKPTFMPLGRMERAVLFLYDLCWRLMLPGLRFNDRIADGFRERTLQKTAHLSKADMWIQAASVGESYLAWTLLERIDPPHPITILLSTNTRQGMEILQQAIIAVTAGNVRIRAKAIYFPFDMPSIMNRVVRIVNPKITVLIEAEIWPGLLGALKKRGREAIIINGRLMPRSLRKYRLMMPFLRKLRPAKILAVSKDHVRRFAALFGENCVEAMPNMKFDQVASTEYHSTIPGPLKKILDPQIPFLIFGSVKRREESIVETIITNINRHPIKSVIGLFPRHMNRVDSWKKALTNLAIPWVVRSKTTGYVPEGTVIIWDVIGELKHAYAFSKGAYVGGSLMPLGGQNFLEPLLCGVKPVIGPYWEDFSWVGHEIITTGLVRSAVNGKDVETLLINDLKYSPSRKMVRLEVEEYIKARQGGVTQAWDLISKSLFGA